MCRSLTVVVCDKHYGGILTISAGHTVVVPRNEQIEVFIGRLFCSSVISDVNSGGTAV